MFKELIKFVKYFGKKRRLKISGLLFIFFIAGCLEFIGIGLIYPFLILLLSPESLVSSPYFQHFSEILNITNIKIFTLIVGALSILMLISKNLLMILCTYLQNKFIINWKNDINLMIMKYYLNAPYDRIITSNEAEKIYDVTVLTLSSTEIFVLRSFVLIANVLISILILSILFIKFNIIALITTLLVIASMALTEKIFKNKTTKLAPKMVEYSLKNNDQVIENIKNLKEIRLYAAEDYFLKKFQKIAAANNEVIFKNTFYATIPPYIIEIIIVMTLIALAFAVMYQNMGVSSKIISSYGLIAAVIFRIAPALNRIQVSLNHMNSSKEMITKLNKLYEKNRYDEFACPPQASEKLAFTKNIVLEDITYEYTSGMPVLEGINLEIKKGEFIGIAGDSGAGKSTLADILSGLLEVQKGSIKLDDRVLSREDMPKLRNIIGYVPQELKILENNYIKNIALGRQDNEIDMAKINECLEQAKLLSFVTKNNIEIEGTIEGLSQGQKQRLLIARALYKTPEIVIMDEATSSLDVETENEIIQMVGKIRGEKTIIAIAHRLRTLKECDKIVLMKSGEIIDIGSFEELEERNEYFKKLINLSKF